MDSKTLEELDYYRIRDEISGFCKSEESKFIMNRLEPLTDVQKIHQKKELSREWTICLNSTKQNPLDSWSQVFNIIKSLNAEGICLEREKFFFLLQFCTSVQKVCAFFEVNTKELSTYKLLELTKEIPNITLVYEEISKIISKDGKIKDLPQLREIQSRIAELNSKIKGIMHAFTSNSKYADILESSVPVLKGDRQVLAVKSGRRNAIPGIIHEMSQSGRTVYIEPEESVKCSNELIQAEFELNQEIRKIFIELATKIRPYTSDLIQALKIMEELDIARAAAEWGKLHNCVFAEDCFNSTENSNIQTEKNNFKIEKNSNSTVQTIHNQKPLNLVQARHPLFGEKAVPIDVKFLEGRKVLIITGPNTGGKTATLKTIALFSMLNQSGFPIPATEGTCLPIFSGIYADIGDNQSIDDSLSTFSGHMKNIAKAVRFANENSLILLDELGSGTDPQEGAAISMAVLDKLIEKNAFVLITTHQGVIKNYGYTNPNCVNASVEFSSKTLSPTYRILMGIPGESHALEIAAKSGLSKEIIKKAKEYISEEKTDVSTLIKGLTEKHFHADKIIQELAQKESFLEQKKIENEAKTLFLKQQELKLKQKQQDERQEFLMQTRRELENLVRRLKEGEVTREKTLSVKAFINKLSKETEQNENLLEQEEKQLLQESENLEKIVKNRTSLKPTKKKIKNSQALKNALSVFENSKSNQKEKNTLQEFKVGAQVIAGISKTKGTLLEKLDKNRWNVQFGSIKMAMKQSELSLCSEQNENTKNSVSYDFSDFSKPQDKPVFELRLLGMRADEAIKALNRQLDLCVLNNFTNFSIIHGKGNGILQQTVQDYLSNNPAVADFKFAPPEDGGFGKTYVTLH